MQKRNLILDIMVVMFIFFIPRYSNGQKIPKQLDALNFILSDTLNPEIYLVPLNIKFENSDNLWIGYSSPSELYQFCKKKYGWNRDIFFNKMRTILLSDNIFEVDSSFISVRYCIPKSECSCLYNESSIYLKQRVANNNFYKYPDNRFSCFVYKCLKNNIVLSWIEGRLVYRKLDSH